MPDKRILLVDEDALWRKAAAAALVKEEFCAAECANISEAQKYIQENDPSRFLAIVFENTYSENLSKTVEFLEWIKGIDKTLAVIVCDKTSENTFAAEVLRKGAFDFCPRPKNVEELEIFTKVLQDACKKTIEARQAYTMEKSVRSLARMEQFSHAILVPNIQTQLRIHYTPHDRVGGDFVDVLPLGEDKILIMVGDVSGHDLKAGFFSAYFQGLVRGLSHHGHGIVEICESFNNIVNREWQQKNTPSIFGGKGLELRTTLSLLAAEVDLKNDVAVVVNCGSPALKIVKMDGSENEVVSSNTPLGWGTGEKIESQVISLKEVAYLFFATDGLEDWAERLNCGARVLSYRLLEKRQPPGGTPPDDLLILRYKYAKGMSNEELWHPLSRVEIDSQETLQNLVNRLLKGTEKIFSEPVDENEIIHNLAEELKRKSKDRFNDEVSDSTAPKEFTFLMRPKDEAIKLSIEYNNGRKREVII